MQATPTSHVGNDMLDNTFRGDNFIVMLRPNYYCCCTLCCTSISRERLGNPIKLVNCHSGSVICSLPEWMNLSGDGIGFESKMIRENDASIPATLNPDLTYDHMIRIGAKPIQ